MTLKPLSERLKPASLTEGTAELMACLTLVAPTGMTSEERGQWVQVARQTLSGIPADLLKFGAASARKTCRFPSEIVPAIMAAVEPTWTSRRKEASEATRPRQNVLAKPDKITAGEAAAILIELGLKHQPEQPSA